MLFHSTLISSSILLLFLLSIDCDAAILEIHDGHSTSRVISTESIILDNSVLPPSTLSLKKVRYLPHDEEISRIHNLQNLRFVKIEGVNQQFLPEFKQLPKLESIYFEHNDIIYVSRGHISTVPVVYVFLRFNNLLQIEDKSFGPNLKHVYLSCNQLTKFSPDWFQNPSRLEVLDLDANRIRAIGEFALKNFVKLDYLYLMHNGLYTIGDGAFPNRVSFSELWLAYNNLKTFSSDAFSPSNITIDHLDIAFNKLTYLSKKFMEKVHMKNTPHIDGNPWQCSCYYDQIIKWIPWDSYGELIDRDRPYEPRCVVNRGALANACVYKSDDASIDFFLRSSSAPPQDREKYCHLKKV